MAKRTPKKHRVFDLIASDWIVRKLRDRPLDLNIDHEDEIKEKATLIDLFYSRPWDGTRVYHVRNDAGQTIEGQTFSYRMSDLEQQKLSETLEMWEESLQSNYPGEFRSNRIRQIVNATWDNRIKEWEDIAQHFKNDPGQLTWIPRDRENKHSVIVSITAEIKKCLQTWENNLASDRVCFFIEEQVKSVEGEASQALQTLSELPIMDRESLHWERMKLLRRRFDANLKIDYWNAIKPVFNGRVPKKATTDRQESYDAMTPERLQALREVLKTNCGPNTSLNLTDTSGSWIGSKRQLCLLYDLLASRGWITHTHRGTMEPNRRWLASSLGFSPNGTTYKHIIDLSNDDEIFKKKLSNLISDN